jgi:hypothetical protein
VEGEQRVQGLGADERAVAAQHERVGRRRVTLDRTLRHHHGVARAELLRLERELDIGRPRELGLHELGAMSDHEHDLGRTRRARRVDDPVHHRAPHDWMHDLGQVGLHARALACGKDHRHESALVAVRCGRHLGACAARNSACEAKEP